MNKNGFAVTGILYTLLLIAIVSLNLLLYNLLNRKTMLDQIKADTVNAIEKDSDFDYLLEQINEIKGSISVDAMYPVGSIYITDRNVNPSTLFTGTTWERYGVGRTLLSTDGTSNQVGGNSTISLSVTHLPVHSHSVTPLGNVDSTFAGDNVVTSSNGNHRHSLSPFSLTTDNNGAISQNAVADGVPRITGFRGYTEYEGSHAHTVTASGTVTSVFKGIEVTTDTAGSGNPFNIMNPYITVYMWKRVS